MRDKFLTEAMGKEWVESSFNPDGWQDKVVEPQNIDFSTWDGYGELFMWATKQDWWMDFWHTGLHTWSAPQYTLNPKIFPDMVYTFLKDKQ